MTAGIRPMYVALACDQAEGASAAEVYFVEMLDEFNIVSIKIGEHRMLIETDPITCPQINDVIWIDFPPEKMNLFDVTTGKNLLY